MSDVSLTPEQRMHLADIASGKYQQRAAFRVRMRDGRAMPGDGPHLLPSEEPRVTKELLELGLLAWIPGRDGAEARLGVNEKGVEAMKTKPSAAVAAVTSETAREKFRTALTQAVASAATIGDGELLRVASSALTELVSLKGPE